MESFSGSLPNDDGIAAVGLDAPCLAAAGNDVGVSGAEWGQSET